MRPAIFLIEASENPRRAQNFYYSLCAIFTSLNEMLEICKSGKCANKPFFVCCASIPSKPKKIFFPEKASSIDCEK